MKFSDHDFKSLPVLSFRQNILSFVLAFAFIFLLVPAIGSAQSKSDTLKQEVTGEESGSEILEREAYFQMRRSGGPDRVIPSGAYEAAVRQSYQVQKYRKVVNGRMESTSWVSLNTSGLFYSRTNASYISGRTNSIAFHPSDPNTFYVAAAGGGVWKTTDGGSHFAPVTDNLSALTSGALAVDPNDGNTVYVATGEMNYSLDSYFGDGIFKSTDGGITWGKIATTSIGSYFSTVVVNPLNSNIVYAAGSSGVYKSTNAGSTWAYTSSNSHANALVMDPANPQVLYVSTGMSNAIIRKTTNAGSSWTTLTNGLPSSGAGRTALAISASNPSVLYASIPSNSGWALLGLYRTTDGGASWTLQNSSANYLGSQGWYDNAVTVHPTDPNTVVVAGLDVYVSSNGGADLTQKTVWYSTSKNNFSHADIHFLGYNGSVLYCGSDGGAYKSADNGNTWSDINQTISTLQFQSADFDPTNLQRFYGGSQDNDKEYTTDGGSRWIQRTTGDGGYTVVDPVNTSYIYGQYVNGSLQRSSNYGVSYAEISPNGSTGGLFYNPYEMAPGDHNTIVFGRSDLWKTTSAQTATTTSGWTQIATSATLGGSVSAIGISSQTTNKIYIGTNSGKILVTTNNGSTWSTAMASGPYVSDLAVDKTNDSVCYASFSGFYASQHVYKTTDNGTTWINVTGNLPNVPVNSIVLRSPAPRTLFIGTDLGVYQTTNEGTNWVSFNDGLPAVEVFDLKYKESVNLLLAATHGRGCFKISYGSLPIFRASSASVSFGQVKAKHAKTDSLVVGNEGNGALTFSSVLATPSYFQVTPVSGSIQPSDSMKFYVTFSAPALSSVYNGGLIFNHNPAGSSDSVALAGESFQIFTASPESMQLGDVYLGSVREGSLVVRAGPPMTITSIVSDDAAFGVTPTGGVVAKADSLEFHISFQPSSLGGRSGHIIFTHDQMGSPDTVFATGSGVAADFAAGPSFMQMGEVLLSASKTDSLLVSNPGSGQLNLNPPLVYGSSEFQIAPGGVTSVPPGASRQFYLTFTPSAEGVRQAIVVFTHNGAGSPDTVFASGIGRLNMQLTVEVTGSWNILSVPVKVQSWLKDAIYRNTLSEAFAYEGSYKAQDTLRSGLGYWMKFGSSQTDTLKGLPIVKDTIELGAGWNMVGSISNPVAVSDITVLNTTLQSLFFGYTGSYHPADSIMPGSGYWIKSGGAGSLVLSNGNGQNPRGKSPVGSNLLGGFNSLKFKDLTLHQQSLYFGEKNQGDNLDFYVLPPIPPPGGFDVRFASNRMVELVEGNTPEDIPILTRSVEYPMSLEWNFSRRSDNRYTVVAGTEEIPIAGKGSLLISNPELQLKLRIVGSQSALPPGEYRLEECYPDPFNPSTTIRYQLPLDSRVMLRVYDVLGNLIATLRDEVQSAGTRSILWNASGAPSGVYFYRLDAVSLSDPAIRFSQVRKVLLVR